MDKKKDRRFQKTDRMIRQGFLELLTAKSIKDITVKDLAEHVDINRATFYLHYKDIYDLLEHIENDMFQEFEATLNRHSLPTEIDSSVSSEKMVSYPPISLILDIFQFLANNSKMCVILLSDKGHSAFLKKLIQSGKEKSASEWEVLFGAEKKKLFEPFYVFISSGCIGLMQHWLDNGMKEPPEEMASLAGRMMMMEFGILSLS